jgi:transposase
MCPVAYFTMTRSKDHSFDLRFHLVHHAQQHGIRAAAAAFQTSRNTVRKWLHRYQENGLAGLHEQSRAPHTCPHQTAAAAEREVLEQRARTPGFGARRLKREFGLKPSVGAIARILRQHGLTRRKKRKHQTKRDLRAVKARYRALTRLQMDVKYLNDIPHYWPQMHRLGLPQFQYTIRCVKTGAVFLAYGREVSVTYAELTVRRLLEHLQAYGIDSKDVVIQTDSGSEFDGQAMHKTDRGFTHTIEQLFAAQHRHICGNPNANADVESFHAHEEPEFFDIETFDSADDFWTKITTYQHYWNLGRLNSYKGDRTPLQILQEAAPKLPPEILLLAPLNLDTFAESQLGHDVPVLPAGVERHGGCRCRDLERIRRMPG